MLAELQPVGEISAGKTRERLEASRRREKACCARRTIPAFEPLSPSLGPHIIQGHRWNVASDRPGVDISRRDTADLSVTDVHCIFTRLDIEYSCMQVFTIWI